MIFAGTVRKPGKVRGAEEVERCVGRPAAINDEGWFGMAMLLGNELREKMVVGNRAGGFIPCGMVYLTITAIAAQWGIVITMLHQ